MVVGMRQLITDPVYKQYIRATNVKPCFWSLGLLGRNTNTAILVKKEQSMQAWKIAIRAHYKHPCTYINIKEIALTSNQLYP